MLKTKIKYTYNDYAAMDDDKRYELIDGELYMVPAPNFHHQSISRNLGTSLWEFVKKNALGTVLYAPFDVVLSDTEVLQPDIIFVSKERGFETFGIYFIDDELTSPFLRGFRLNLKDVFSY